MAGVVLPPGKGEYGSRIESAGKKDDSFAHWTNLAEERVNLKV
jgi:hypothetical protein